MRVTDKQFAYLASNHLRWIKATLEVDDSHWQQWIIPSPNNVDGLYVVRFEVKHDTTIEPFSTGHSFIAKCGRLVIRQMDQFTAGMQFKRSIQQAESYLARIAPRPSDQRIPA